MEPEQTKLSKKARKKNRRANLLENQLFDNSSVSSNGSIANIRSGEQEKKRVRENLSKTTDEKGNLVYPDVDFWDNKTRRWVKLTGPAAVPWEDVDLEITRTATAIAKPTNTSPPPAWQPDNDTNLPLPTPPAKGCWSSPSTNLWDSNGVDEINAAELFSRVNKTKSSPPQSYTTMSTEIPLNLEFLQFDQYYDDSMDLTCQYDPQYDNQYY